MVTYVCGGGRLFPSKFKFLFIFSISTLVSGSAVANELRVFGRFHPISEQSQIWPDFNKKLKKNPHSNNRKHVTDTEKKGNNFNTLLFQITETKLSPILIRDLFFKLDSISNQPTQIQPHFFNPSKFWKLEIIFLLFDVFDDLFIFI